MRMFCITLFAALICACGSSKTKRVDPADDDELMGTGLESADIEHLEQFSTSLLAHPALARPGGGEAPTVAIHPIENNTRFDFDAELLVRRIRQKLVENAYGRVRFVTRANHDEAMIDRERAEKRMGERTATKTVTKTGADYYLTGTASAISKVGKGRESDAIWIDFRLVDAENGEILWEDVYKTKKVGKAGVIYR